MLTGQHVLGFWRVVSFEGCPTITAVVGLRRSKIFDFLASIFLPQTTEETRRSQKNGVRKMTDGVNAYGASGPDASARLPYHADEELCLKSEGRVRRHRRHYRLATADQVP